MRKLWAILRQRLKIMIITMSVSGALGTVMIPRTSNLIAEGKMNEFKLLIQKSYDFILAITMPLTVGLIFISKSAILLLSGDGFVPAILTSQIVAFNILMVGISGVMGLQVLYPMGKINIVIICTGIGAVINVLLNVWLIPKYGHNGTAVAYMLAEVAVTVSMFIIGRRYIPIQFFKKEHLHYVLGSVVMGGCLYILSQFYLGSMKTLVVMIIAGCLVYTLILLALKNSISTIILKMIKRSFIERRTF